MCACHFPLVDLSNMLEEYLYSFLVSIFVKIVMKIFAIKSVAFNVYKSKLMSRNDCGPFHTCHPVRLDATS